MGFWSNWLIKQEQEEVFNPSSWAYNYSRSNMYTYTKKTPSSLSYDEIISIEHELKNFSKIIPDIIDIKDKIINLIKDISTYNDITSSLLENKQLDEEIRNKIIAAYTKIYPDLKEDRQLIYKLNEIGRKNGQYAKVTASCLRKCKDLCNVNISSEIKKDTNIHDIIPNYKLCKKNITNCLRLLTDIDLLVNHYDFDILLDDDLFIKLSNSIVDNEINLAVLIKDFNKKLNFANQMKQRQLKPYKIVDEYATYFLLSNEKGIRSTLHKSNKYYINDNRLYTCPSFV